MKLRHRHESSSLRSMNDWSGWSEVCFDRDEIECVFVEKNDGDVLVRTVGDDCEYA